MSAGKVTQLLQEFGTNGNRAALDEALPFVYDELRRIAARFLQNENAGHTLQPTALVHEAYLKLVDQRSADWRNRAQFFGLAAAMMRRILVNHAERKHAAKRGGENAAKITLDEKTVAFDSRNLDLLALNEALERLANVDALKAQIVELKFFGGLTNAEVAEIVCKSDATVEREWAFARAWLRKELKK